MSLARTITNNRKHGIWSASTHPTNVQQPPPPRANAKCRRMDRSPCHDAYRFVHIRCGWHVWFHTDQVNEYICIIGSSDQIAARTVIIITSNRHGAIGVRLTHVFQNPTCTGSFIQTAAPPPDTMIYCFRSFARVHVQQQWQITDDCSSKQLQSLKMWSSARTGKSGKYLSTSNTHGLHGLHRVCSIN